MSFSKPNTSAATLTRSRTKESVCPFSGLCATCLDGCAGFCEVGKSAYRGKEVLYPQPFGKTTSASEKDYPVDLSHFNIMGTAAGAVGIEADSDRAIFPAVDVTSEIGGADKIKLRVPLVIAGMGSTDIARVHWDGLAAGAAISGAVIVIGENVCGMDPGLEAKDGRVRRSPHLEARLKAFRDWYDGYGAIAVQANVEDTRLGVLEYAIEKLGVEAVELKWGQGAKDIGGEVKLASLERALQLKQRGYIVLPDPEDPAVQKDFERGVFREFERHSRIGMVEEESFLKQVEYLRGLGAKFIFLKTGAYRPVDLARAVKLASAARLDLLTVDGAGGGTGMSPWRMMNEWGIPTVYIEALLTRYLDRLAAQGAFIPSVAIAGGFTLEDHLFKGFALGAPYVKAIGMARAPLTAAMVGRKIGHDLAEENLSREHARYGDTLDQIFVTSGELKARFGKDFSKLPPGAIGVYTYFERLSQGLRQLMCGARKFALKYIDRNDIAALTREAGEITGISYIMDLDREIADEILSSRALSY
ncbi:MAG: FMN-binding glutamate synthase family protein [Bacillota bacterium]|nr:FMN-binding glutamate synthase family protein [Bacillota bacterium]